MKDAPIIPLRPLYLLHPFRHHAWLLFCQFGRNERATKSNRIPATIEGKNPEGYVYINYG